MGRIAEVGELRPSQMMFSFGVGAVADLPYLSVMVMGLDAWQLDPATAPIISEDRLLNAVRMALGDQVQEMRHPPVSPDEGLPNPFNQAEKHGVPVTCFPRWLVCPQCRLLARSDSGLFELKTEPFHPERTRWVHRNCRRGKDPVAFPARFMVTCENGHLDDFPWRLFVHRGPTNCRENLQLIERGPSGEARDIYVRCGCGRSRALSQAFGQSGRSSMPMCRGHRPHLSDNEECDLQVKAILLGASNLWFPYVLATLAIPVHATRLGNLVQEHWADLEQVENHRDVEMARRWGILGDFSGYTTSEILQSIERHRSTAGQSAEPDDLKTPEWDVFTRPASVQGSDDLSLREVAVPDGYGNLLAKVVLADRLREVRALIGFTRMDDLGGWDASPTIDPVRVMDLSRSDPAWVPATEVRGEGIFIQINEEALQRWLSRPPVTEREASFKDSHVRWRRARHIDPPEGAFPGMRYVLLHSFAHALMRQLCLECGYTAASLRERIYARGPGESEVHPEPMAGVLIYTAASDSEGTLGGLAHLGEPEELSRHLRQALIDAGVCASDPLCAEHEPSQQGVTLHAAACHACLLAPETSCERGNRYLDRSVLARTVERDDLCFFGPEI